MKNFSNFFKYISERFIKFNETERDAIIEQGNERQRTIDRLTKEGVLTKPKDGKRYAINRFTMSIYEIVDEKDSFFKVRDNQGNISWEEKSNFFADNIVYDTTADFICKEREKLLSMIDTSRYEVYIPMDDPTFFGSPSPEHIEHIEKQNAESLMKFIKAHTTSDFKEKGFIFSNYILIGY